MKPYAKRKIEFHKIATCGDWRTKVHTITYLDSFNSEPVLEKAISQLPGWLEKYSTADWPESKIASLIVHEGKDGVWSILSTWVGENMLRTITFFTPHTNQEVFRPLSGDGSMACVWELAVICHERRAWIEHVLMHSSSPNYERYLSDTLTTEL